MIRGHVRAGREPLVPVTIYGRRSSVIEAVVDTGFTGHICVAANLRRHMALRRAGEVEMELADGRRVEQAAFLGEVSFDGKRRTVLVTLTRSADSLIGTSLLAGKTVRVRFVRGGAVVVSWAPRALFAAASRSSPRTVEVPEAAWTDAPPP